MDVTKDDKDSFTISSLDYLHLGHRHGYKDNYYCYYMLVDHYGSVEFCSGGLSEPVSQPSLSSYRAN